MIHPTTGEQHIHYRPEDPASFEADGREQRSLRALWLMSQAYSPVASRPEKVKEANSRNRCEELEIRKYPPSVVALSLP